MREVVRRGALLPARAIMRQSLPTTRAACDLRLAGHGFRRGRRGGAELSALLPLQRAMYLVANVFLLLLGLSLLPVAPASAGCNAPARAFLAALPMLRPLLQRPGAAGRIALGLVWGLVPCALVYSVLPLALFAGGAWQGGAVMLAFGLGTLPNLGLTGVLLQRAGPALGRTRFRFAAASLLVAFALLGIYRAVSGGQVLATGAYCLVP